MDSDDSEEEIEWTRANNRKGAKKPQESRTITSPLAQLPPDSMFWKSVRVTSHRTSPSLFCRNIVASRDFSFFFKVEFIWQCFQHFDETLSSIYQYGEWLPFSSTKIKVMVAPWLHGFYGTAQCETYLGKYLLFRSDKVDKRGCWWKNNCHETSSSKLNKTGTRFIWIILSAMYYVFVMNDWWSLLCLVTWWPQPSASARWGLREVVRRALF